jgi:hypothetical protein
MNERIHSKRLYLVAMPQGISGFHEPSVPAIVTGARKRRDLLGTWTGARVVVSAATFRLNDGHLPEFQPTGGIGAVTAFLATSPMSEAIVTERGIQ